MRRITLALAFVLVVGAVGATLPAAADADTASISRHARGPQPDSLHDPLGGPATPRVYLLGQNTIFAMGVVLLIVAAALGAYTLLLVRRSSGPR
jgi:hypothetical protein